MRRSRTLALMACAVAILGRGTVGTAAPAHDRTCAADAVGERPL